MIICTRDDNTSKFSGIQMNTYWKDSIGSHLNSEVKVTFHGCLVSMSEQF